MAPMKTLKNISFKNRLALSYSFILALMLISAAIFYHTSYHHLKKGLHSQTVSVLSSSVRQMDDLLKQIHTASLQLSSSSSFKALADSENMETESFSYSAWRVQEQLKLILPSKELNTGGQLFIYLKNSGYILSSNFFSELELARKHDSRYTFSVDLMSPSAWRTFIPVNEGDSFLYICPVSSSLISINGTVNSVLCFMVDRNSMERLFPEIRLSDDYQICALDKDGSPCFSIRGSASPEIDLQLLFGLSYSDKTADFKDKGRSISAVQTVSDYNGWNWYLIQPSSTLYYSAENYQRLSIVLIILTVLLESGFIVLLTAYNSRSVVDLSSELENQHHLASALTTMVEQAKPLVSESYIRKVMEGNITTNEQMERITSELGLKREGCRYQVLYIGAAPRHAHNLDAEALKLCIENHDILVQEALKRYFPDTGHIYKPGDAAFACLIAVPSARSDNENTEQNIQIFRSVHQELLKLYDIEIRGGLGNICEVVPYIWKSYQEAHNAWSMTTDQRCIISSLRLDSSTDTYYFPESLAVQLSGFISTGSSSQTEALFSCLKEENLEKRTLSFTQLRWLVSDIRTVLFRKRLSVDPSLTDAPERKELLDLIDRQFENEISLDSLQSIALQLCSFYGSCGDSNELIQKIQNYLNRNYMDSSLSLSKISEEFHISENYFSFLFKKEVSENFSVYLEKLRMAKAKELVLESSISISELYQYTGYNNAASFRRAFKKKFGVSPKEMREKAASGL